jgi:TolA protein
LNGFSDHERISRTISLLALCLFVLPLSTIAATTDDEAAAYLGVVEKRIMAMWNLPPKSDGLTVTLRYTLVKNGSVSFVRVENSSGNQTFDDSAVQAVRRASPFPPPPHKNGARTNAADSVQAAI